MTNLGKYLVVLALVLGAVGTFLGLNHTVSYGSTGQPSTVDPNPEWFSSGQTVGSTGTYNKNTQFGSCNPTFYGTSLAATSTGTFVCNVSGIAANDVIFGDMPANIGAGYGSIVLLNAYSTTTGIVAFTFLNLTGAATTSFPLATTSVEYLTYR